VQLLLDKSERQEGFTPAAMLSNAGVSVFLDGKHGAARSHVIVIDSDRVITGSLSFTRAADETDSGDLVLLHSRELAAAYTKNWHNHKNHSDPY
jgi:phosphatidylserine/phosphatidylglycerophosphate/cardiolipin synthase-like enzyme